MRYSAPFGFPLGKGAVVPKLQTAFKVVVAPSTITSGADYYCDGVADNVEIQTAIDAAYAAGGGTVILRTGTYNLGPASLDFIKMKSNVTLQGEGQKNTVINLGLTGSNTYSDNSTAVGGITTSAQSGGSATTTKNLFTNITIRDLTVKSQNGSYPITAYNTSAIRIQNVEAYSSGTNLIKAGIQLRFCQYVWVQNSYVHDTNGNGININGCDFFWVTSNIVQTTYDDGIDIDYDFDDTNAVHSRYGVVMGNHIDTTAGGGGGNGIRIENSDYVRCIGNYVANMTPDGIWVGVDSRVNNQTCTNIVISNNIINNCTSTGIHTQITGGTGNTIENIEITGNDVFNCGANAGSDVRGGIVHAAAVTSASKRILISNNNVNTVSKQNDAGGIIVYKTDHVVIANNIVQNAPYGVHIWNEDNGQTYTNVTIANNLVKSSTVMDYYGANNSLTQSGVKSDFIVPQYGSSGTAMATTIIAPTVTTSTSGGTLAAGTYYYKVSALDASGNEGPASLEASVVTSGTTSSNRLTWVGAQGAWTYRIYRGTSAAGENVYYTSSQATYLDTNAASTNGSPSASANALINKYSGSANGWFGGANKIGIGNTSPQYTLDASGESNTTGVNYVQTLATPAAPSIVSTGGSASTWTYKIVAKAGAAVTAASSGASTTVGAATLDGTHYNDIFISPVTGATSYDVYRTAVATSPSTTGKIGNVLASAVTLYLRDNGLAGDSAAAPSVNTTGRIGVGTTTPAEALHMVTGDITVTSGADAVSTVQGTVKLANNAHQAAWAGIQGRTNASGGDQVDLLLYTGYGTAAEQIRVLANTGQTGFNVTAPTAQVHIRGGQAGANLSPLKFNSGTNLTSAEAGTFEYDGVQFYNTIDTTSGRGAVPVEQYFHLTAAGSTISTIANYFGTTSNISLVASAYYIIDIYCYFLKTTAGTVTWTFTNSAAPTSQNINSEFSPATGIITGTPTASQLQGNIYNDATAAKTIVSGTLTTAVNHYAHFKIFLQNGTGTSLKIQATASAGTITPGINSYWFARRISPNNIGTFAA